MSAMSIIGTMPRIVWGLVVVLSGVWPTPGAAQSGAAVLWAPGEINTPGDEYGPAFTPDGQTVYFVTRQERERAETIVFATMAGGHWTGPSVAPFSGKHLDKEPFVSADGSTLVFASTRPGPTGGTSFDLWRVERAGDRWGEPRHLGPGVNTDQYENYPALAANGSLYFSRRNQETGNDLYRAPLVQGGYPRAEPLAAVNTPESDADPYIAPDEGYIIFSSTRPGGLGGGDLYVSLNRGGGWTPPRNLGPKVNSTAYEYTPLVSPDGQYLYFSRDWGEIWRIETAELDLMRPRD